MIGSTTVKHQPIGFARKVSSAFNTAKILVKSVINVVGPVAGIDQAFEYSRKWHAPMFRWDGLNWVHLEHLKIANRDVFRAAED